MAAPRQMTANTLNALKGWPRMDAVDFEAELHSSVTVDPVLSGTVVSLHSSGDLVLGVGNVNVMPMFLIQDSDDPDVSNDGGDPATTKGVFVGIIPPRSGVMSALVAIGAYELVSTQFVSASYPPNTLLTAATGNGATAGKLVAGTLGTNLICGVVSRGVIDNGYGHDALAFWPVMFPVYP